MTYSSNKYVGVAFDLDGNDVFDSEVTKLNRGASAKYDFSDSNLGEDNNILVGYSQGGETYSADDFVPAAKDYHVKNSIFAKKALSYTLVEPEQASLAYRRVKDENGVLQDPEVALRWSFELSNFTDLVNYFGAADFGYRMWAKDTEGKTKASKETFDILTVEKGSALTSEKLNVSKVNLQLSDYNTQFLARAIARFGYMENGKFVPVTDTVYSSGMTYKGTTPDSLKKDISGSFTKDEKTNKGRSAAYVAQKAIDDARSEPTEEAGFNYCNAIVTADGKTKYHYLTQAQYKMLLDIVNAA